MKPLACAVMAPDMRRRRMASDAAFFGVSALCLAASIAMTIAASTRMSAMGSVPMPGGWTLSMTWTPMCGQTWARVAATFVGVWIAMTVAMMLPSLMPMLCRYRESLDESLSERLVEKQRGRLTALVSAGYFAVWIAFGSAVFAAGATLAELMTRLPALARGVPLAAGIVVLISGLLQFTAWKLRHLECCRAEVEHCRALRADARGAWRYGLQLGVDCCYCSAGLTMVLLVIGVMDFRAMALITTAITSERLARDGQRVARVIGVVMMGGGLILIARGAGLFG